MKDLKEFIEDAVDGFVFGRTRDLDLDDDTEYDIEERKKTALKQIYELLEEMDADIDTSIEQMKEPSDREVWNKEFETMRL